MKVYLIYAIASDDLIYQSNYYGQYDIFKNSKQYHDLAYVLWGFTDKKSIRNQFFKERPVSDKRYYEKIIHMTEGDYSTFMLDHFRYELLPIAYDTRMNIGEDSGYLYEIPCRPYEDSMGEDYVERISTKFEYDYLAANAGEIVQQYHENFYSLYHYLPTSSCYKNPFAQYLEMLKYNYNIWTYTRNGFRYSALEGHHQEFREYFQEDQLPDQYHNEFSLLKLLFIVFHDMIWR